jgi:hypothetical protein
VNGKNLVDPTWRGALEFTEKQLACECASCSNTHFFEMDANNYYPQQVRVNSTS